LHEKIVKPAAAGKPRRPRRREDRTAIVEFLLGDGKREGPQVARGRKPGPAAKFPRKMKNGKPRDPRELAEIWLARMMTVNVRDDPFDAAIVCSLVHGASSKRPGTRGNPDHATPSIDLAPLPKPHRDEQV